MILILLSNYRPLYKFWEKAMATYSSALAWEIPWMEEPGRLQYMGLRRVEHDWATSVSLFTLMHWRRKWQPTPVFLPRESQGREPGGLPSMGSHRVGHDWSDLAAAAVAAAFVVVFMYYYKEDNFPIGVNSQIFLNCLVLKLVN